MDHLSADARSQLMARVRQRNTVPEIIVRRILHGMGYRFSLHRKELPGTPDIFLRKHRKAVQVFGCFWHGHECRKGKLPKSRTAFWRNKIQRNRARDTRTLDQLRDIGIEVLVVWECETKNLESLGSRLRAFLASNE